jgi:hypothetical protein
MRTDYEAIRDEVAVVQERIGEFRKRPSVVDVLEEFLL